ncbi:ribosome hibernation-promoting factor, HPF/YfiA family [Desulfuribacillus alkaliarsenatis]|uniref:Ribosome hibernation promoting factor n=1 Tax=Desulfuribacillus alkaliarsenatis TaxID=766136 RepID=A0A1E5G3Z1_9FIRM|nr:ribosome-associated translation inhibitor RaiA [Desulfuribacillus alkaliarsenatis]OEF97802.1 ribosomal subunit interface protein [Desulfuribacillus alkaliarsenatis]
MKYNLRGHNIEVTESLREYVEKKLSRIEKYFDELPATDVQVTLRVLKSDHTIEVTLPLNGMMLRAEETSDDMYASIDLVVEKLERQIRKYKTRVNRKYENQGIRTLFKELANNQEEKEEDFSVVKTKAFNVKPMVVEEAILQMNLIGHNFFVFLNAEEDAVNVVYKRNDGKYALIKPQM